MASIRNSSFSTNSSSHSSWPFRRCAGEVDSEGVAPHFELMTLVHELEEPICSMDCQSDVLALLGETGRLIVRDTMQDSHPLISTIRNPHRVFLHPAGDYVLVAATDGEMHFFSMRNSRATGHFALHRRSSLLDWAATTPLQSTTNSPVAECVCWLPAPRQDEAGQSNTSLQCLVGSKHDGFIFLLTIDIMYDGSVKSSCRLCLQLPAASSRGPVASIHVEQVNGDIWVLFVSTVTRLYRTEGRANSPTELIDKVAAEPSLLRVREAFAAISSAARGTLALYRPSINSPAQSYAWTSAAGIVHGLFNRRIDHDLCKSETAIFGWNDSSAVVNEQLLALTKVLQPPYSTVSTSSSVPFSSVAPTTSSLISTGDHLLRNAKMPLEIALTAFHMILLYDNRLVVLNHPAGLSWRAGYSTLHSSDYPYAFEIEERIRFDPFKTAQKPPELRGIVRDTAARKIYIFGKSLVWELQIEHEHRHQWWLFLYRAMNNNESLTLRKRFFQAAYNLCKYCSSLRNLVQLLRGKFFLHIGAIQHATDILADCDNFEDVYHLLVSLRNSKVLQLYVEKRYKLLVKYSLNKSLMQPQLASLFALILLQRLDGITRCDARGVKTAEAAENLNLFLKQAIDKQPMLFENKSYNELIARLLEGQGRPEVTVFYAEQIKKVHYLLTHYVSQGLYTQATDILLTHSRNLDNLEIWYEFAPILMKECPIRFTTAMSRAVAHDEQGRIYMLLQLERLIPVFVRYTPLMNEDPKNNKHQVINFLERCITKFDCVSSVVHNYYLSLLAQNNDERLEEFLEFSIFYNVEFALRRCLEARRYRQCVGLYRRLHLYEDAIRTALDCSEPIRNSNEWPTLCVAKDLLKTLPGSFELSKKKKLWLILAKYVLKKCNSTVTLNVLEESHGIIKLEDILEDIADGLLFENYRDALCKSLDAYTNTIARLKEQHVEASQMSRSIKKEISLLDNRFGYITAKQRCPLCNKLLLQGFESYFIYPSCRHAVHEACAISKLTNIGGLEAFVADEGLPKQFFEGITSTRDLAQMECVICGEASIIEIEIPLFIEDPFWSVT